MKNHFLWLNIVLDWWFNCDYEVNFQGYYGAGKRVMETEQFKTTQILLFLLRFAFFFLSFP